MHMAEAMEWFYCFVLVKVGTLISTIILRSFLLTGICGLLQVGGRAAWDEASGCLPAK